jgi:hypothetical protein
VSHRPLALLSGLTLGDYLLWNWSLSVNHGVLALVAGLSLPPLAFACLWLLAVNIGRVVARSTRRARAPADDRRAAGSARRGRAPGNRAGSAAVTAAPVDQSAATVTSSSSAPSPGKLAA